MVKVLFLNRFRNLALSTKTPMLDNFSKFLKITINNREQKVKDELKKWEMNFSAVPAEIIGKHLPAESLCFGGVIFKVYI